MRAVVVSPTESPEDKSSGPSPTSKPAELKSQLDAARAAEPLPKSDGPPPSPSAWSAVSVKPTVLLASPKNGSSRMDLPLGPTGSLSLSPGGFPKHFFLQAPNSPQFHESQLQSPFSDSPPAGRPGWIGILPLAVAAQTTSVVANHDSYAIGEDISIAFSLSWSGPSPRLDRHLSRGRSPRPGNHVDPVVLRGRNPGRGQRDLRKA